MDGVPYDNSGRFYINCNTQNYLNRGFFLGGPIAILVNKKNVQSLWSDFGSNKKDMANDFILSDIFLYSFQQQQQQQQQRSAFE